MRNDFPVAGISEQVGTARFANNSSTSASSRASALTPALTVTANALRVGNHLLERLHS
jgi:hypothetical protein